MCLCLTYDLSAPTRHGSSKAYHAETHFKNTFFIAKTLNQFVFSCLINHDFSRKIGPAKTFPPKNDPDLEYFPRKNFPP